MHMDDAESDLLKTWVIKKLENISDADSDVLADYVLALIKTDEPLHVAKSACVENLRDFLAESSEGFVNDLYSAIGAKAYDPARPPPKIVSKPASDDHSRAAPGTQHDTSGRQPAASKKRSYHDWDRDNAHGTPSFHTDGNNRPIKQARRGGRGGLERGSRNNFMQELRGTASSFTPSHLQALPQMPGLPPGMAPFDPNNPMASFMAMQQFMGIPLPEMPGFAPLNAGHGVQRCSDYDTKGFCNRGANCPFEHGNDRLLLPGRDSEYDPAQATLLNVQPNRTGTVDATPGVRPRGGHRGRGRGGVPTRGNGRRADFSHQGPIHDETATTIVVEQIPDDKFNGDAIKGFFAQFGHIADITLRNHKRIALIQFEDHRAANDAYNSPKVVFDNRFVKVYWHKPQKAARGPEDRNFQQSSNNTAAPDVMMEDTEQPVDTAELARRQEEAQRKYETSKKQREEQQQQKLELDLKLKAIEAERSKMAAKLAHKAGGLRAQLAKLEAEAKSLGIDPDASADGAAWGGFPSRGRGRGSFRGRPGRAGFYPGGRGGWAGGAVKRLDNRPKIVAISFIDGNYEDHDEALRQYLLFSSTENVTLTQHPSRPNVALLAFTERYLGEIFMKAATAPDFPLAGKIELAWHKPETDDTLTEDAANNNELTSQEPGKNGDAAPTGATAKEVDYDVAADDDLWG
ncbi:uncharacterized protein K489DRAFT_16498 [Dissoconium aciculare CBS 342.82]|uniref:CCCH zinc finger and RRM domain-containing protein n=1 Tax=Dissoconium aciculare CBS 342.82 TaxID=1314786 RepID=A0A6J3MIA0_9PEZI|nr:uncharacterized protein K489DRAFT_16498 [Dissoconium aciculare CBS 342.82]KAF1827429.1 hypothetical protein K489DRAFT_16498 [Dissoconium aciculare CBS 342.82]